MVLLPFYGILPGRFPRNFHKNFFEKGVDNRGGICYNKNIEKDRFKSLKPEGLITMKNYNYSDMNKLVKTVFADFGAYKEKHPNLSFSFDDNCDVAEEAVTSVLIRTNKNGDVKVFTAKCNSNDIYDMNIGYILVALRAMGVQYTPKAFNKVWFRAGFLMPTEKFIYENRVYTTEYLDDDGFIVATDKKGRTYHIKHSVYVNPVM